MQDKDFSCSDITPSYVDAIYKERGDGNLAQYITALCLVAPPKELNKMFNGLRTYSASELAHILCAETASRAVNKFTIQNRQATQFDLFRNGSLLRRFKQRCLHIPTFNQKKSEQEIAPEEFQSLLVQHGITESILAECLIKPVPPPPYLYNIPEWNAVVTPVYRPLRHIDHLKALSA